MTSPTRSFSVAFSSTTWCRPTRKQLPACYSYRLHSQFRFYTYKPPSSTPDDSSRPPQESSEASNDAPETSLPQEPQPSSSSPPPSSDTQSPQEQEQDKQQQQQDSSPQNTHELPSQADSRRSDLSQNFSHVMDNLQSRVLVATQTINDLTGYSAIESIKAANARLETDLATAQEELRRARQHYKAVNARRAGTQREVTTLLARKDTWTPVDLERFTTLYRQDHELEAAVAEAATALTEAEAEEARLSQALNSGILKRYHEEQIWSDRIRRQSTWGTWGLMGVNILLFLVLQFVAEPWKRNRLMKGIAAEEKAALEAVQRELEEVKHVLSRREAEEAAAAAAAATAAATAPVLDDENTSELVDVEAAVVLDLPEAPAVEATEEPPLPPPAAVSWKELLSDPSLWRPALEDLCSERRIDLRMRDASILALEGAVTGAAIVASLALLMMRWSR